eukprot:CAMPEP_0170638094 /NCGR_PEP_ID=MMETSP0224-20130122/38816_1 /TAXON_ID=285029 /ORGANISM="Togula jolla, Strain CCCM 725" /LENGTH=31 /DNA_ID= /DNA_START= /DNA_END= /DNA_ORIENTATION=
MALKSVTSTMIQRSETRIGMSRQVKAKRRHI